MKVKLDEKSDALRYLASFGIKEDFGCLLIPRGMQVGIKLWAVIDFLCHKHKFQWRKI